MVAPFCIYSENVRGSFKLSTGRGAVLPPGAVMPQVTRRCVEIRRFHRAVVPSVGCSSMDPGHHGCCCDLDGAIPDEHRGVGGYRNHGMLPG